MWKQIVDPGAGHLALTTIQTYDDAGNVVGVTDPRGGVSTYQWNARRLLTHGESPTTSSGFPYVVEHDYDTSGRRIATRTVNNTGGWEATSFLFDADGRVISAVDPAGDEIQTAYDLLGRTSIVTDPMGRRTRTEYFADGLVQRIQEAYGTPLQRDARTNAYNNNSELLSVTSAKGFTTSYQFDGYGRLAQANYPVTSTSLNPNFESFGYDNNGNPTSRRTRSGAQFTLVYDAMNRLIRETGPDRRETFGYDASSLRTCAEVWPAASGTTTCGSGSPTHRVTAAFDLAMRVSSESARRAGTTRTVSYQYDANSNRSRVTWPDGWYASYVFDAFNQLTAVDDSAAVALWRQSWRRDARLGNILRTGTAWNSGASPAEGMTDLIYEADGDVALMSHRFLAQGAGTQFNFTYGYNLASQLVSEAVNQPNWQWAGTTADTVPYAAANALDQYPSVDGLALTYDTNGNRTGYSGLTTTHDAENRLTAASKTGVGVTYLYDADGRRVWKDFTSGGSDTDFLSAGQMEIAEYDSTGKLLRRYVPGVALNERLVMINCGAGAGTCPTPATFSYTTNRQGSIIALVDSAGAISDRYLYTPYGVEEPLVTSANPFRYTGQRFDPETGLYYYHARYYDPQQGRFLETDPVAYEDDLNLYAYVYSDPLNRSDPSGRQNVYNCSGIRTCQPPNRDAGKTTNNATSPNTGSKSASATAQSAVQGTEKAGGVVNVGGETAAIVVASSGMVTPMSVIDDHKMYGAAVRGLGRITKVGDVVEIGSQIIQGKGKEAAGSAINTGLGLGAAGLAVAASASPPTIVFVGALVALGADVGDVGNQILSIESRFTPEQWLQMHEE